MRSIFLTVIFLASGLASAATVQLDGTDAVGISNLNVGGVSYDVVFDDLYDGSVSVAAGYSSWINVFGESQLSLASTAAGDMAVLLNTVSATGLKNIDGTVLPAGAFEFDNMGIALFTGYDSGIPCFEGGSAHASLTLTSRSNPGSWGTLTDDCVPFDNNLWATAYFKTAVPVPAAFWLFASALAGLGWLKRRP